MNESDLELNQVKHKLGEREGHIILTLQTYWAVVLTIFQLLQAKINKSKEFYYIQNSKTKT